MTNNNKKKIGRIEKVGVDVEISRLLTEFTRYYYTFKEKAHNSVCWNSHTAFVVS